MCVACLPVAAVPLWQVAQLPLTWLWSTRVTGFQNTVEWQDSQFVVEAMWVGVLPVAMVPLWQLAQPVVMPA